MSIQELIDKANTPVADATPVGNPTPDGPSPRIEELIEAQKNRPLDTLPFGVTFGDEPAEVVIIQVLGDVWEGLTRTNPRPGNSNDAKLGCDTDELVEKWPLESVTIDGDHPTREQWVTIWRLIDAPERADILAAIWWIHWGRPREELSKLGVYVPVTPGVDHG